MRLRRREINVFSMSALDLFASGMGAFIMLAVMALPFFPNTGDSPERIEEVKRELATVQQERDTARNMASSLERALENLQHRESMREAVEAALADALAKLKDSESKLLELEKALAKAREPKPEEKEDDERERALEAEVAEAKEQLDDAKSRVRSLEEALAKARMPDLDIVICLDVTASMTQQIDGLKREISVLAEILDSLTPSTGIGLVAFGDRRWRQPIHIQQIVPTSRILELQAFTQTLRPNMDPGARRNTDGPEAVATAVERAVSLNWRAKSKRRYVIAVTDNAAYPSRESAALQAAQSFASTEGQFVSTVRANFAQNQSDREAADRFLRQLAQSGRGQFIDAAGGESMIGSLLLAVIGT